MALARDKTQAPLLGGPRRPWRARRWAVGAAVALIALGGAVLAICARMDAGESAASVVKGEGELSSLDAREREGKEPAVSQVSLSLSPADEDGAWDVTLRYTTPSSEALSETFCRALCGEERDESATGSGSARTYSALNKGGAYNNPDDIYTSPYLHRCVLRGLGASRRCALQAGRHGPTRTAWLPPRAGPVYPFVVGAMADVGQTEFSNATMSGAAAVARRQQMDVLLFPGDLSYSDGEHRRWDSFGRLADVLLPHVEAVFAAGNHELENNEAFVGYRERYAPGELWHVRERGPVCVVTLSSYSRFDEDGAQMRWLRAALAKVDRSRTPWLLVQFHAPFVTSSASHQREADRFARLVEPLLVRYRVDLVLNGHVHAYERSHPTMTNAQPSGRVDRIVAPCGVTHIVVGDGGNREKASAEWVHPQPRWSAFREASFGFGTLTIYSDTLATWQWRRNPAPWFDFPDQIVPEADPASDSVEFDRRGCR